MKISSLEKQIQVLELHKSEAAGMFELESSRLKEELLLNQQKLAKLEQKNADLKSASNLLSLQVESLSLENQQFAS